MNPQFEEEKKAIEQAVDERRNNTMDHEEVAALQESTKPGEAISSDMDEAARVAEEALKRLNGEL